MIGSRLTLIGVSVALFIGLAFAGARMRQPETLAPSALAKAARSGFGKPHIGAVAGRVEVLKDVRVVDFGQEVYRGAMDLNPTIDRIRKGEKLNHRNDGSFFGNRERRLPRQQDREYYREFVHTLHSPKFPGPQRVVIGKDGSVWYTGDHYDSLTKVTK